MGMTRAQSSKMGRIEVAYDFTGIGSSAHILATHEAGNFNFLYGLRYHMNHAPVYDGGKSYWNTMHAKNFLQHFGPVLGVQYVFDIDKWSAKPFLGYYTQLGAMTRQVKLIKDIPVGSWQTFEEDSPLVRWENQIVGGFYSPLFSKLELKLYSGLGVAGLFNIESSLTKNTYEFGFEVGLGVSYRLR